MQQLVFPSVGAYTGAGNPFTLVATPLESIRGFPRGLDVMVVLGSDRALSLLDSEGDTDYLGYDVSVNQLLSQFQAFGLADWTKNLYWGWLFGLRPLLAPCGPGYPAFMQSTAWQDKQLNTALASWAELRHDTILYAKQSTTPVVTTVIGVPINPPPPPPGYVEPVPEVYERLRALTSLTHTGLANLNVLNADMTNRLAGIESVLARLRDISVEELQGQAVSDSDNTFITTFYATLAGFCDSSFGPQSEATTMVADVHTDANTQQVLEEGVGYVKLVVAACSVPQQGTFLAAGPVFSGYEFKWPMSDRLTDSEWTNLLAGAEAPALPDWTASFMDPVTLFPDAQTSSANAVKLLRPQFGADGLSLQWAAEPALRYRALYSPDLSNWFLLQTPISAQQDTARIVDPGVAAADHRFYKVKLVP
jgi:hypothetical protein